MTMKRARNFDAWAIGTQDRMGFHVRRVVWGQLLADSEKRDGEQIRRATILVEADFKKRRDVAAPKPVGNTPTKEGALG